MVRSLLTPPDVGLPERCRLDSNAIHDLSLEPLARSLSHQAISPTAVLDVLRGLPQRTAEIEYRQAIVRVLWERPDLCTGLNDALDAMQELTVFSRSAQDIDRPLVEAVWRLGELELYVEVVERLRTLLRGVDASGLGLVRDELDHRAAGPDFVALKSELPALRSGLKLHQSVTIGVNLDDRLRPVEAALLSVNDRRFREGQILSGFLGKAVGDPYVTQTPLHRSPGSPSAPAIRVDRVPLSPLFDEIDGVLKSMLRPLARKLRAYVSVQTDLMRTLVPELAFYLGAVDFYRRIQSAGYPVCFPSIREPEERIARLTGLYNIRLADHWSVEPTGHTMVMNDLTFDDAARLYVLTGPNGGGKTTFTQSIGAALVLAHAGLPVPAQSAEFSPIDGVYTHFATEEKFSDDVGRFEDEAQRLSAIFDHVGDRSLVLLNEPLASTGPREAETIAATVLEALGRAGCHGVLTTHLHGLAHLVDDINNRIPGAPRPIGTLNAGTVVTDGRVERTFRIDAGPPTGSSYADDIARRYRLDAESLRARLDRAGGASDRDRR